MFMICSSVFLRRHHAGTSACGASCGTHAGLGEIAGMGRPSDWNTHGELTKADQAAREAQRAADALACRAWNVRMKQGGPRERAPSLHAALNGGYRFLRVQCRGCKQHAYVDLTQV